MISDSLIIIALCLVAYGAFSSYLSKSVVSGPMVFMLAGLLAGPAVLGLINVPVDSHVLEGFGELTLGFILFADAASANSRRLATDFKLPGRLLLIGLPLTIALGALVAFFIFPELSIWEVALVAAILAPTDAALGYAVVTSKAVPERIRQAILVESGINDGLALPAVLLFAALAFGAEEAAGQGIGYWLGFTFKQIFIGAAFGAGAGALLGKLIHDADDKGMISHTFRNLICLGVAVLILLGAHAIGGNGFIAAFIGGLVFGSFCKKRSASLTTFVEEEGQLFSLLIFFFFGAVLLPDATEHLTLFCVGYALLSLTVIRMVPMVTSLIGTGVKLPTSAFIGWFGPRGLASILFLFIALEHREMTDFSQVEAIVYITVALSIILHGVTASPLSAMYGLSAAAKADS